LKKDFRTITGQEQLPELFRKKKRNNGILISILGLLLMQAIAGLALFFIQAKTI